MENYLVPKLECDVIIKEAENKFITQKQRCSEISSVLAKVMYNYFVTGIMNREVTKPRKIVDQQQSFWELAKSDPLLNAEILNLRHCIASEFIHEDNFV